MSKVFDKNCILLNQHFDTKYEAIDKGGQMLIERGCITPEYIPCMYEREDKFSVYLGNGIAIPHGSSGSEQYIKKSGVILLQAPDGVSFGEDKTAYVIICIAGANDEHLDILAKIAVTVSEPDNVEAIRTAASPDEILKMFDF